MFDSCSPSKIRAGGKINTCAECSEESEVKYLGLANGDGKQASVTVLAFKSKDDRNKYASFWKNNSGLHKSRSCQLGAHLSTDPGVSFRTVSQSLASNHKGRM
jgi:hypothetical protein